MEFEQLKTFVSLANTKNFTRTAEDMNVVQSTVTTRIKILEEKVGEKLFIRKTRSVEITEAGKTFLVYARQTLELMTEGIQALRIQSKFDSRLVIGGMNSIWDTPIFDQIHQYYSCNQNTAIRLVTGHSQDIIEKIHYGLIDVGFVYNPPKSSLYNVYKVREEALLLVGTPRIVNSLGTLNTHDLMGIPFVHYNWGMEFSEWFELEIGKHETMRYRVDHSGVALRLLLKGEGIGFMMASIIEGYEEKGLISQVPLISYAKIPKRKIYMVCPKNKVEKVNLFMQNIIQDSGQP